MGWHRVRRDMSCVVGWKAAILGDLVRLPVPRHLSLPGYAGRNPC